jgi:predicted NUDIX family phosphoesterase
MLDGVAISRRFETQDRSLKTVIEASADILREAGRSLHAHEIACAILSSGVARLSGPTPWKTVSSRLSTDIRNLEGRSQFQRDGHARFALREWGTTEFLVNKRRINPIDETIKVVQTGRFQSLLQRCRPRPLYNMNVENLVAASMTMKRANAEETVEFVQLIPTFIVRRGRKVLTYRRTKRLPEARLHNSRCVSFGGHMQADDVPSLFARSYTDPDGPMFRELYEELRFSEPVTPRYLGVLYLTQSEFERQHAGIVFDVNVSASNEVENLETTRHGDVQFSDMRELACGADDLDSWSRVLLGVMNG